MKSLTIKRVSTNDDGTYGVLLDDTTPFALTLEKPWHDNTPGISCIPAGIYVCKRVISAKFGETFEVTKVPGRKLIRFHWGNTKEDTRGCPLIAEEFGFLRGRVAILVSQTHPDKGFNEFMQRLKGYDEFLLTVIWWPGIITTTDH